MVDGVDVPVEVVVAEQLRDRRASLSICVDQLDGTVAVSDEQRPQPGRIARTASSSARVRSWRPV